VAGIACPMMFILLRRFIKALDDAIRLENDQRIPYQETDASSPMPREQSKRVASSSIETNPKPSKSRETSIAALRKKMQLLLITSTLSSFIVMAVCLICTVFQFEARTVPLAWLIYYACTLGLGMFVCQLAHSAKADSTLSSRSLRVKGSNSAAMLSREIIQAQNE
jgi:hypothetical protein